MGVSINIKMSETILKRRGVKDCGAVQRKLDSDVLNYCSSFVPRKSGALINSGYKGTKIGSGVICYSSPYARYQYYGKVMVGPAPKTVTDKDLQYTKSKNPLAGPFWDRRMMAAEGAQIREDIQNYVRRRGE